MSTLKSMLLLTSLTLSACHAPDVPSPGALSPKPVPPSNRVLQAGFARAEITPPPGVGLAGNGPEGSQSQGYRMRLYARVLVLSDADGDRLAIVVGDLALSSALLQRRVAEHTSRSVGIGVDRLIIAATHTHAGPGHYFEAAAYNQQGSSVSGYDEVMVDSLAARIARAVDRAVADLQPARVAWGSRSVWGLTRIRSLPAMLRDIPTPVAAPDAPVSLLPEYRLVNPELAMLRVDRWDTSTASYRPLGAFSIFAMHGTGNAPANDLLDPDIHGIAERRVERHIEQLRGQGSDTGFVPRTYYLLANGAEGDVSPAWPPQSRCGLSTLTVARVIGGPLLRDIWTWQAPTPANAARCEHAAREAIEWIGDALGDSANALFDALGHALTDQLPLARAFVSVPLRDSAGALGLCADPAAGMSAFAGADDAHTRVDGWRLLGLFDVGLEQGGVNRQAPPCHREKHLLLDDFFGQLGNHLVVTGELPSNAEFTVFQLGDRLIGTLPGEATTTVGRRMQAAMLAAAHGAHPAREALILGHANGYLEYITTSEEYTAQFYEGGSTLYGPNEADVFTQTLTKAVAALSSNDALPPSAAPPLSFHVGGHRRVLPTASPAHGGVPIVRAWCSGDTLYARITFGGGRGDWVQPTDSPQPRVEIRTSSPAGPVVAWDDDPNLEMRLAGTDGSRPIWEMRWSGGPAGRYVVVAGGANASASCATTR